MKYDVYVMPELYTYYCLAYTPELTRQQSLASKEKVILMLAEPFLDKVYQVDSILITFSSV